MVLLLTSSCESGYRGGVWAPVEDEKEVQSVYDEIVRFYNDTTLQRIGFDAFYDKFKQNTEGMYKAIRDGNIAYSRRNSYADFTRKSGVRPNPVFEFISKDILREKSINEDGEEKNLYYSYKVKNNIVEIYEKDESSTLVFIAEKSDDYLIISNLSGYTYCKLKKIR